MVNVQSSASGLLSLLSDTDVDILSYAIEELNEVVGLYWAEVSEYLSQIEALSESSSPLSPESRQLASLLCSKLYFYLGALDEAVDFALNAGDAFGRDRKSVEYRETIIAQCLDRCIQQRASGQQLDPRLVQIAEGVLENGRVEGGKLTVGLILSLRRLDLLERTYLRSTSSKEDGNEHDDDLLRYVLAEMTGGSSGNDSWDNQAKAEVPDYTSITQIWLQLSKPELAAESLSKSIKDGKRLEAFQISFDLADSATQSFLEVVTEGIDGQGELADQVREILRGDKSIRLYLEFLSKNNHSDLAILKNTKDALEARYSIFHSAVTFANAFAHAGTTSDQFLRENLDWLGKASNWSMFSATAALGVIHKGSLARAMTVLGPYLPANGSAPSPYQGGGALYALGLIHAKHGKEVMGYLTGQLKETTDETLQHGAALGLGVAGIASLNEDVYDALRDVLFQDSSVAGEACGYAMGLIMLGSGSDRAMEEMLQYAHETQHEKIIRGLAIGIAFLQYGRAEQADSVIDQLLGEKDAILRYGAMYTIALAYVGTANNQAIRKLLSVAVSDANDDVRRAAVTCLGIVMFRNHVQVPRLVQLLSESYNPHVRYGATLALGISCAGTGLSDAIELLEPMAKDPVDFVRQGAFMALAMIQVQQTEAQSAKAGSTRKLFERVVADRHEDSLAKFGAAVSQGIIDAGGRNATLSLQSRAGTPNMLAVVGVTLFTQFWYWYPLAHCLSLAFTPTAVIGLDETLKIPKIDFVSAVKPSMFAYPAPWKAPVKETVERVASAVLSTTARANARAKNKEKEKATQEGASGSGMDVDQKTDTAPIESSPDVEKEKTEMEKEVAEGKDTVTKKAAEPTSETLPNMSRVVPAQLAYISFPSTGAFQPVRSLTTHVGTSRNGLGESSKQKKNVTSAAGAFSSSLASVVDRALAPGHVAPGGGILMLRRADGKQDEAVEYIELNPALDRTPPQPAPTDATSSNLAAAGMEVDSTPGNASRSQDEPEAEPPAAFDYPFGTEGN